MKIIIAKDGKKKISLTKSEWKSMGKKAGWVKMANSPIDLPSIWDKVTSPFRKNPETQSQEPQEPQEPQPEQSQTGPKQYDRHSFTILLETSTKQAIDKLKKTISTAGRPDCEYLPNLRELNDAKNQLSKEHGSMSGNMAQEVIDRMNYELKKQGLFLGLGYSGEWSVCRKKGNQE